jgi:hypothetical protein
MNKDELESLFQEMQNLLLERGQIEELDKLNMEDFKEWVNRLKVEYIENDIEESFYKFVQDYIYETVCYE